MATRAQRPLADKSDTGKTRWWLRAAYGSTGVYLAFVAGAFAAFGTEAWLLLVLPVALLMLLLLFSAGMKLLFWAEGSPIKEVLAALIVIAVWMGAFTGLDAMWGN